ncbi:hypothetical protein Tco_0621743 [Tanacetum coccineum]
MTLIETCKNGIRAHYLIHGIDSRGTPYTVDTSGPIFMQSRCAKVQNDDDNYNVFANEKQHLEQPESVNVTYLKEHGDTNITTDSLDMSNNRGEADQDEDEDLARERDLLASLIDKLKCKIDDSKNRNKLLESSNKTLVDKLKGEIEDFKTKNKSLESSNNHFKEANNKLSKTNQLMFKDLKKFQAELDRDGENLDKMKEKGDACIFVSYGSKSSAVTKYCLTAADAHDQRQQHNTTSSTSTIVAADTPPLNIQTTPDNKI